MELYNAVVFLKSGATYSEIPATKGIIKNQLIKDSNQKYNQLSIYHPVIYKINLIMPGTSNTTNSNQVIIAKGRDIHLKISTIFCLFINYKLINMGLSSK